MVRVLALPPLRRIDRKLMRRVKMTYFEAPINLVAALFAQPKRCRRLGYLFRLLGVFVVPESSPVLVSRSPALRLA